VNASLALRSGLRARLGYGITAKAPTLSQLYPGPRFFDLVNFSHYAADPAERLVVITTRRVEPANTDVRAVRTEKRELGLDWELGGVSGTLTAFHETTHGAFGMTRFAAVFPIAKYRADSFPQGRPPVLAPEPAAVDTFIGAYDAPRNTRHIRNKGIELTADFPEWRALRTALSISGGWIATRATDDGIEIDTDALFRGPTQPQRLGVYPGGAGGEAQRLVTSVRLVQCTPALGLVASLLAQTIWLQRDRPIARSELPVGYLDRTGTITPLTPEQAGSAEFAELRRVVSPLTLVEERRPPLWLFDLRLSKALPAQAQFSLFVNNAFADRPLYRSRRSPEATPVYERRNPPLFFGAELVMRLPGGPRI
jgi:outer membrane receptor protein involved in Fe transport